MSEFDFAFLLVLGIILLVSNIILAGQHGKPQKPFDARICTIDALVGFVLILIAFGVF